MPGKHHDLKDSLARKRDIKQFRQACQAAGLTEEEVFEARLTLHAAKRNGDYIEGSYADLLAWLREWKEHGH